MSNQNLPKLFFFNIEPWKEVYNDRFLLKQLQEKGFPIEYVWIGPLVGLLSNVPSKGCETIPKSWKEIQRIINLDRNKDAILISLMPVFAPCLKLFRILSKAKQKMLAISILEVCICLSPKIEWSIDLNFCLTRLE